MSNPPTSDPGATASDDPKLARVTHLLAESSDPSNPGATQLRSLLARVSTVAVIGHSRDPLKAARRVPSYLAAKGYRIIPVNPNADSIMGRQAVPTIEEVSEPVDLVLLFRPSGEAGRFVQAAALRKEGPAIWLQEGIRAPKAVEAARSAGLTVVQDLCIFKVHRSLPDNRPRSPGPPPRAEERPVQRDPR